MWKLIVSVLMLYMAYSNVRMLVELPFSEWGGVQWMLVAVTVGLVVAAIFTLLRYRKDTKDKKEEEKEKQEAEEAQKREEALQRAESEALAAAQGAAGSMGDAEGALIEREMDAIDSCDELEGYELVDISLKPHKGGDEEEDAPQAE